MSVIMARTRCLQVFSGEVLPAGEWRESQGFERRVLEAVEVLPSPAGGILLRAIEPIALEVHAVGERLGTMDRRRRGELSTRKTPRPGHVTERLAQVGEEPALVGEDLAQIGGDFALVGGEPAQVGEKLALFTNSFALVGEELALVGGVS
jgi:hypothetical protein